MVYGRPMPLDPHVQSVIDAYLAGASGLVSGMYLYGSVALDDFRYPHSDIDFVALVDGPLDTEATTILEAVHQSLPGPVFDGIYLTAGQLAAGPEGLTPTPFARDRRLHEPGVFEHNPITWHTLVSHGIRCAGPDLAELKVWQDPARLKAYTRTNVDEYWRGLHAQGGAFESEPWPGGIMWIVLGIPRLHYTLATGGITSKTGGGQHALATFGPKWHPLIKACLAQRLGGEAPSPALWPQALDFLAMAIEETVAL